MIETIINYGLIWLAIGFSSAFIDIFVFFRGMKHMIDCHVMHKDPKIKQTGLLLLKEYNGNSNGTLVFVYFFVYSLLGIFTTYVLVKDFFVFTFTEK